MTIIVCIDSNSGLMFNHRRQSKDKIVCNRILEIVKGSRLWMNAYSAQIFDDYEQICIDEDFLQKAMPEDFCFIENNAIAPFEQQVNKIILFNWNRTYPADMYLDISPVNFLGYHIKE